MSDLITWLPHARTVEADSGPGSPPTSWPAARPALQPTDEQPAVIARRRTDRCWWSPAPARARPRPMALRVIWLVANAYVAPRPGARAHLHPQGGRRAGPPDPAPPGPGQRLLGRDDAQLAGEPTVATYHSFAARIVREHGLRAGFEPTVRLLTEAACWQLADAVVRAVRRRHARPSAGGRVHASPTAVLDLAGELAEHLRAPGRARRVRPAGSPRRCSALPGRDLKPVRDVLGRQRAGCAAAAGPRRTRQRKAALEAMDFGDQFAPRGRGRPRPPRGRRDRAGPVPGRAARRVPGHLRTPRWCCCGRCSAAATR